MATDSTAQSRRRQSVATYALIFDAEWNLIYKGAAKEPFQIPCLPPNPDNVTIPQHLAELGETPEQVRQVLNDLAKRTHHLDYYRVSIIDPPRNHPSAGIEVEYWRVSTGWTGISSNQPELDRPGKMVFNDHFDFQRPPIDIYVPLNSTELPECIPLHGLEEVARLLWLDDQKKPEQKTR